MSKNKIIMKSFKNGDMSKLRVNFSTTDINPAKNKTRAFNGLNKKNHNFKHSNSTIIEKNQSSRANHFSELMNNYNNNFNKSFPLKGTHLEKIDINIYEKIINSPFQSYQTNQKNKGNNINNKANLSSNIAKKYLFESKEKDKKNKNRKNNNFQQQFFNIKGKEAKILQKLVNNLQSNIPQYEQQFINDEEVKNMINTLKK
jgi:hypothetical protein